MALGIQWVQNPPEIGTAVRSACQVCPGYFDTMRQGLFGLSAVGFGASTGFSFRIRPTVVVPIWMPALANLLAIFVLPRP